MCHVWPAGWIGPEITIIMCYVPSKLTILSKRSRPKENLKCQTKFEAAERIMMMQAVNLVRALKCFLLRWSLNTAVPLRVEFFCDFWCSVWSRPVSRPKWTQRRQRSACRLVFAKINRVVDHSFTLLPRYYCVSIRSFRVYYSVWASFVLMNS